MKKSLLLAGIIIFPAILRAQQNKLSLDEVVVTANKFDQKASQTGKVVTVISQDELARSSGKTLGMLLNEQAGMTINGSSESPGTNQTVYLRGSDPKYTLIMIDGIPVNDVSYNDYKFDLNLIPLAAIERIEIMRGGYASLYGSGATAGVINIITKKGGEKPFNATAGFSGGSYGTFREQAGFNGHTKHMDYNVQLQNLDSKGFSSALDSTGHQGFDKDGFHRQSVYANFGIHPNDQWTIRPFVNFAHEKGDMDADAFTDDKDYYYTSTFFQTGLNTRYTFTRGDINIKYSFNPIQRRYLNDSSDGSGYEKDKYQSFVHTADIFGHLIINPHVSLLLGNYIRLEKTAQTLNSINPYYTGKSELSADSAQADIMSIYGSLFIKTNNGFHMELGGRLNQHKIYGFHPVFSINPSWLIRNRVKLFANVASSFNSPSLYQLYSIYGNRHLDPETGISYEGGIETLIAHDKLKLRGTAFDRNMKNIIGFYDNHYVNYNRQKEYGGEVELSYMINDQLRVKGYYAYVNGQVTVKNDRTKMDSTYNNLFKRPENSGGLSVGYQVTPSLYIDVDGKYTGACKDLTFINSPNEIRDLKSYILLNVYAQYTLRKKYKVFLGIYNATNSHFIETTGFATKGFNFDAGLQWSLF